MSSRKHTRIGGKDARLWIAGSNLNFSSNPQHLLGLIMLCSVSTPPDEMKPHCPVCFRHRHVKLVATERRGHGKMI